MFAANRLHCSLTAIASGLLLLPAVAGAELPQVEGPADGPRWELWLTVSSWPDLADLEPAAGGGFDDIGYGLGAAVHWPLRRYENSELLLGVEGAIIATDSSVPVFFDDLLARDGYLAVSAKWLAGRTRSFSLDAGLAYHLLDIAQLDTSYYMPLEFQSWEESAPGVFVGATWDVGAARPGRNSGLAIGLRAHFVDFGSVRDEDVFIRPVLGDDAGNLNGPMLTLQVGYRWR